MIRFPFPLRQRIVQWAELDAPSESCGVLIGRGPDGSGEAVVERVTWARNLRARSSRDSYELDPEGLLAAECAARARGQRVLGVWHSHPAGEARPSETDRAGAWEGWSYVIVGGAGRVRSWRLEAKRFLEEECA